MAALTLPCKADENPGNFQPPDYSGMLTRYQKGLEAAEEKKDTLQMARLYFRKGETHVALHHYYSAIVSFQRCLRLRKGHSDITLNARAFQGLGDIYLRMGYYTTALSHYKKAFLFGKKSQDTGNIADNAANIGRSLFLMDSLPTALQHYKKAAGIYEHSGDSTKLSQVFHHQAEIFSGLRQEDSALFYYNRALEIEKEKQDLKGMMQTYLHLGKIHLNTGNTASAVADFKEAMVLSKVFEDMEVQGVALKMLAKAYGQAGRQTLSYAYYQRYVSFDDSLTAHQEPDFQQVKAAVKHEKMSLEHKRLQKRFALLSKQRAVHLWGLDSNRVMIISLTTIVVLFIALLVLYYERYREKKNRSSVLEEAVKKRTAELDNAYRRLSFHVNNTFLGLVEMDYTTAITKWSRQAEKIFGWTAGEALGKTIGELGIIHKNDLKKINLLIRNMERIPNVKRFFRTKGHHRNGDALYIEWNVSAMFNDQGILQSILCMANDATEREKAFSSLETANKELDNFIYKTSHDVRGPIARIQGIINLGLIEAREASSRHYFNLLGQVASEFDIVLSRLFRIHNLYYHKPEVVDLNLHREITNLLNKLKSKNDLYDLEYRLEIAENLTWKTDKLLLYMIIQNLYENALDYRSQGLTYVLFSAEIGDDGKLRLKVKDNGIGISEQVGDRVFDMFFQSTRNSVTSGLGLYMVKKSVEKLGGTIELVQQCEEDTVFEILLPDIFHSMPQKNGNSRAPHPVAAP